MTIKALNTLNMSMKGHIMPFIVSFIDPKITWKFLIDFYIVPNNVTRLMFKNKLITIKLGNYFNVMEYSQKILNIQFELETMVKFCMNKTWWKLCFVFHKPIPHNFGGVIQTFNGNLKLPTFVEAWNINKICARRRMSCIPS